MAMTVAGQGRAFQPFEYMAWAKAVAPGAAYPMNVSGLPALGPAVGVRLALPSWEECLRPSRELLEAFGARLGGLLGAPGRTVLVTGGASEAILVAMAPFVSLGDPVIVEQPAYRAMECAAGFLGGVPVRVERHEAEGWRLDPERLDAALRASGARVVGITDPHNPTGTSISAEDRAAIIAVVERHDALLVVDETFASFRGHDRAPAWAASSDHVLSLGSLTKGWGLSSLRTGWVLGAPDLVHRCDQVFDLLDVNPPTATLALALAALDHARTFDEHARRASERVHAVFAATDWGAAGMVPPHDGIIGYLRLPPGWISEEAARRLREQHGVQTAPGHFFGHDDHLRVGFTGDGFDPAEGCRLIAACLNGW